MGHTKGNPRRRDPRSALLCSGRAPHDPRTRHRADHPRGLRQALPPLPRDQRRGQAPLRAERLGRRARSLEGAHPDVRPARERGRRGPARSLPGGRPRRVALARDQARLHRALARPPAARVRRDVLQLRRVPRARPALLPEREHLLAARDLDRAPRRQRAHLPLLLPHEERPPEHGAHRLDELRPRRSLPRPRSRRAPDRALGARALSGFTQGLAQLPDPGALVALLPQQGGVPRRPRDQRARDLSHRHPALERRERRRLRRRAPPQGRDHRARLQPRARLLHGRHGSALGLRHLLADDLAEQAEGRVLHDDRPAKAGQDALLPRHRRAHEALDRHLRSRRRNEGPRHGRLHVPVVSLRLQGDPRLVRAAEAGRPPARGREVPAREVPRPGRAHGRHPRVLERRAPPQPLRPGAPRRAAARGPFVRRGRRRSPGHQACVHRAAHDADGRLHSRRRRAGAAPLHQGVLRGHQGAREREHLPGRYAPQELRRHALRARRLLRLRRDRVPHRGELQAPARGDHRRRRDVRRALVLGVAERRVPPGAADVHLRAGPRARHLHGAPRRPRGSRLLDRDAGAHSRQHPGRRLPLPAGNSFQERLAGPRGREREIGRRGAEGAEGWGRDVARRRDVVSGARRLGVIASLVAVLVHVRTIWFGFTELDDRDLVVDDHAFLVRPGSIVEAFGRAYMHVVDRGHAYYRPLVTVSYALDARWSGVNPAGYHATNVALHAIATALFFALLERFALPPVVALGGALVFAVHPALASAVAWIPGRNDSLFAVFALSAWLCFMRDRARPSLPGRALHFAFFALALLTKETAIALPLVWAAEVVIVDGERRWRASAVPYAVGWAALCVGLVVVHGALASESSGVRLALLVTNLPVLAASLGKVVFPFAPTALAVAADVSAWPGVLAAGGLIAGALLVPGVRGRVVCFGIAAFVALLAPVLAAPGTLLLDNRLYLPACGVLVALAELARAAAFARERPVEPRLFVALSLVLVGVLAAVTAGYEGAFQDRRTFAREAVAGSPHSDRK